MNVDERANRHATELLSGSDRTAADWRAFYEEQGRVAIEEGESLACSTEPISDVLRRMAVDSRWSYISILDVGCGANVSCA